MPTEYRLKRRVNFYETDAAGIVHFSTFFRYMEEAEHALWREAGLGIARQQAADGSPIGWPRVQASFEYFRPIRFEEEFEILIRIEEIAEKRIRYGCELICDGVRIAAGSMTIACVSRHPGQPMKSVTIPPEIRARFQP